MVKQREGHKVILLEPAKSRILKDLCPVCEKPKSIWTRRTDWNCCSKECTEKHQVDYYVFGWGALRLKAFFRDKYTCVRCGLNPRKVMNSSGATTSDDSQLIGDHIIPIACGGDEWDLNNIQTLCISCNKIKTAQDASKIAQLRDIEKKQSHGQQLLV
jgi:5-methylcytosine-specific restriction endonuclease McrA